MIDIHMSPSGAQASQELRYAVSFYVKQYPEVSKRTIAKALQLSRNRIIAGLRTKQSRFVTGMLARSINTDMVSIGAEVTQASVGTELEYAKHLEDGTKSHWVAPVSKRCLAWRLRGGASSAKKWIGAAFHKASATGKWGGWGHSKGHMVSGIKAWKVFYAVEQWLNSVIDGIMQSEIDRIQK